MASRGIVEDAHNVLAVFSVQMQLLCFHVNTFYWILMKKKEKAFKLLLQNRTEERGRVREDEA